MIARIWHGWTTPQNADAYERLLKEEIFVGIAAKQIAGYKGVQLLRREVDDETEFTTIMWFDTVEAIKSFTGKADSEEAYVPNAARLLLVRFDARAAHSVLQHELTYP